MKRFLAGMATGSGSLLRFTIIPDSAHWSPKRLSNQLMVGEN
jgi:hypothetical protein